MAKSTKWSFSRLQTALSIFAVASLGAIAHADPLHKVGADGAWQHEGSGWLFPKRVGDAERIGVPYTIDGNNDVGVAYAIELRGKQGTATVEVFQADSAAIGAQLDPGDMVQGPTTPDTALAPQSQAPFVVPASSELLGVIAIYESKRGSQRRLYYFKMPEWIVAVRASMQAGDEDAATLDEFVRALPWETLGSDTSGLHGG